jgi:hypothetical protein
LAFIPNSAANYGNLLHMRVTNFAKIDRGSPPLRRVLRATGKHAKAASQLIIDDRSAFWN